MTNSNTRELKRDQIREERTRIEQYNNVSTDGVLTNDDENAKTIDEEPEQLAIMLKSKMYSRSKTSLCRLNHNDDFRFSPLDNKALQGQLSFSSDY